MAKSTSKKAGKGTAKEQYLKIPYHILNIPDLDLCEKVLLAHIYSFGAKGCWQSNATLGKVFMVAPRTIKRWLARIVRAGLVQVKSARGYYRTIWARSHPDIRVATELYYRGRKLDSQEGQNCPTRQGKSGTVTGPNRALSLGQKCPTTNNTTKKDTMTKTTAPPSPLPAGGQAPAVLAERRSESLCTVEQFSQQFGRSKSHHKPLSEQEFEDRRQQQRRALLAL